MSSGDIIGKYYKIGTPGQWLPWELRFQAVNICVTMSASGKLNFQLIL